MARKGLPRKYAKMGFKRGWAAYKKAKRAPVRRTAPKRKGTYAKTDRRVRHTRKNKLVTKAFIDGLISGGGKIVMRKVLGSHPIYEAAFDVGLGYFRHNKTLMGIGIVNGATSLLPGMNILGGQGQEPWIGQ